MRYFELTALVAESRVTSEEDFTRAHPGPAFIIEPFVAPPSAPGDEATETETWTDRERPILGSDVNRRVLHPKARIFWISESVVRFGRDASCEVALPHPRISRQHATIKRVDAGAVWLVEDHGSSNGTVLNGRSVKGARLNDGDILVLGEVVVLRAYFTPAPLYRLLRDAARGSSRFKAATRINLELLASTVRSLGAEAELREDELRVKGVDGTSVHVRIENSLVIVESSCNGVGVGRNTVALNDAKVEETTRKFVFEAIRFQERPQK